ncbi:hypothetical protein GCM10009727_83260 [Actinomadura napierensis]|uniref:Uncharacterized protein n=1 Tax=Actinomadura napierensis TaxID=267854 RepID=A0ABN3AFT3_9ACTN
MYTKKAGGHWYAKAVVRSSGRLAPHCELGIDIRHGSGPYQAPPGNDTPVAVRETLSTHYYLDDPGSKARACLSNRDLGDDGWHCGAGCDLARSAVTPRGGRAWVRHPFSAAARPR